MCFTTSVMALECNYAPAQQAVRDSELVMELEETFPKDVDVNATYPCGGTLGQLAILRGNMDNLQYLLDLDLNPNAEVSLKEYKIPGAPETVPLPLFAAYYAPTSAIIDTLVAYDADFHVKDSLGHDVFWYFDQNPALRKSYLTKNGYAGLLPLRERILLARKAEEAAEERAAAELAKNPPRLVPVRKKGPNE